MRALKNFLPVFLLAEIFFIASSFAEIKIKTPAWEKVKAHQKKNEYIFVLIDDAKSKESKSVEKLLQKVDNELGNKCAIIKIRFGDTKEEELMKFFRITRELIPLILVIAPNGAVTGVFSKQLDEKQLKGSVVSAQEAEILLSLQEGRIVFLCFYNDGDTYLKTVKAEVGAIAAYFKGTVDTFYINKKEIIGKTLFTQLEIADKTTVFTLVPPGRIISKLEEEQITRKNLLQPILSSCGSGCGSGCK